MFTPEQIAALSANLNPDVVSRRSQAGRQLDYIEGWHAIAEANRIFGHGEWHRSTIELRLVAEKARKIGEKRDYRGNIEKEGKDGWGVSYIARVQIVVTGQGGSVTREGVGAGHGIDVDLGQAHESAAKEAETDATKRALATFGWPLGLALYDKSREHVGYDEPATKDHPPPNDKLREVYAKGSASLANGKHEPEPAFDTDDALLEALKKELRMCVDPGALDSVMKTEGFKADAGRLSMPAKKQLWKFAQSRIAELTP